MKAKDMHIIMLEFKDNISILEKLEKKKNKKITDFEKIERLKKRQTQIWGLMKKFHNPLKVIR